MNNKIIKKEIEPIPCELEEIPEYPGMLKSEEKRSGRYTECIYQVPDYGSKWFAFNCYVKTTETPIENLLQTKELSDIVLGCIQYLNTPEERKKFEKSAREPRYGTLKELVINSNYSEKKKCLILTLLTSEKKNRNLWGEGFTK